MEAAVTAVAGASQLSTFCRPTNHEAPLQHEQQVDLRQTRAQPHLYSGSCQGFRPMSTCHSTTLDLLIGYDPLQVSLIHPTDEIAVDSIEDDMQANPLSTQRNSETTEQQKHEEDIIKQQNGIHAGLSPDPHDLAETSSSEQTESHAAESKGFKGKLKDFWENTVKPAFPEAIADINILTNFHSIEHHVTKDLRDVNRFPEVAKVAEVRRSGDLSDEEKIFMAARRERARVAFAKYIGVDESEVHPDDVPNVSFGGSGGGFRAMIAMLGYCEEMKQDGLWDFLTHVAGVSGSCWSLAAYYSFGDGSMQKVIDHCKERFAPYHPLSSDAIRAVLSSPGGARATLGPLVQKHQSGLSTVAMDLYSVFTTGHIFLHNDPVERPGPTNAPKKEVAGYHENWFRFTNAQKHLSHAQEPLPILTAIRHERPWKDWVDEEHPFKEPDPTAGEHAEAQDAWFQWFEITPYEIGCDELEAFVPTWAFGRPFSGGKSTMQLPEQSLALLLGLCTSAPAGPLTSYLATINRNLPKGFIGNHIHSLAASVARMWGKQGTEVFQQHHPLHACNEHNFLYHHTPVPANTPRPKGIENSPRIHLIDSGMDNNCPTYVLLHPERKADVIINMDASSDVLKDTFPSRVNQIGYRRGIKFTKRDPELSVQGPEDSPEHFTPLYAQIYDGTLIPRPPTVLDSYDNEVSNPPARVVEKECTMIYMPLLPNYGEVPGYDPSTTKWSGSYNLVWTGEQVDILVRVARGNWRKGRERVRECLRGVWRERRERRERGVGEMGEKKDGEKEG